MKVSLSFLFQMYHLFALWCLAILYFTYLISMQEPVVNAKRQLPFSPSGNLHGALQNTVDHRGQNTPAL